MEISLLIPTEEHAEAVMAYRNTFLQLGESLDGTANLRKYDEYRDWLSVVRDNMKEETVRAGLVQANTYLAMDEKGQLVGLIDLRMRLNDYLMQYAGNIGYSVLPSARRKGYATEMLRQVLAKCSEFGISRVLVTCDRENEASRRTILKNGGVLENEVPEDGGFTQRYWITADDGK